MGRKATTLDEQINILKSRGMIFDCGVDKAKELLSDIGYYRLGFYWNPFETDKNHTFKVGTKFTNVIDLYYFDVDLKFLLIKALNRIEINIRSQIIYIVSNKYTNSPTWFSDSKTMENEFIKELPKYYNKKFIRSNKPIKAHHIKHINDIYAPAWKTLEFLTFGVIFKIFENLKDDQVKLKIANHYGIKKTNVFSNYFRTILFIRNICAHSGLLFDSNTHFSIIPTPMIKSRDRHSLNTSLEVVLYFLNTISDNRYKELKKDIDDLFNKYNMNKEIKNVLENKTGYRY